MGKHGTATLPLHSGTAPRWLFDRMVDLGEAIGELIIKEFGQAELLRRLADPYWFQAFGCALGFDWHSSGLTTTTMGALKEALNPEDHGIFVVGGKGSTSRQTPDEISNNAILSGGTRDSLIYNSKLSAIVDNACVQDTYTLYHHTMVITEAGDWCVVQQGMNDSTARRYHWLSDEVDDFIVEPQNAICSQQSASSVLDLTAINSEETRDISLDLVQDDPTHLKQYFQSPSQRTLTDYTPNRSPDVSIASPGPAIRMPAHHELRKADLSDRTITQLEHAYELQPTDYEELVTVDGVGPKSLRALALIAELVYDAESSHDDPAKYAFAHGGKDGTPHPVDRERYDRSIEHLRQMIEGAEMDTDTKQASLKRVAEAYERPSK